jgi:hypothetical protein
LRPSGLEVYRMTRAQRDAAKDAARRCERDALRARMTILEPMLDALNEEMSGDERGEGPIRAEILFAPGEDDRDATLPGAIEIRTPTGVACWLEIAPYEAVLKLEWLPGHSCRTGCSTASTPRRTAGTRCLRTAAGGPSASPTC